MNFEPNEPKNWSKSGSFLARETRRDMARQIDETRRDEIRGEPQFGETSRDEPGSSRRLEPKKRDELWLVPPLVKTLV